MSDYGQDMNEEKDSGPGGDISAPDVSRRRFLQKSSTVALITTLAAQPVWGQCTVSGATSGGSGPEEGDDPCVIPHVSGRSPEFWSADMNSSDAVISAFPYIDSNRTADLRCYIDEIKAGNTFYIPSTDKEWIVAVALASPGSLQFNLAAIWLNAHFDFFTAPLPGVVDPIPQDWVNHFDALFQLSGYSVFDEVFTEGSTSWNSLPADYVCPP